MIRKHTCGNGKIIDIEQTEIGSFLSEDFSFRIVQEEYKPTAVITRKCKVLLVDNFPERLGPVMIDEAIKKLNLIKELLD